MRLAPESMKILWMELMIFSIIYGLIYRSGIVFGVVFIGLAMLIKPKRAIYAIFILGFMWAFIFVGLGYDWGGWQWATVLGAIVYLNAIRLHFRDLKWSQSPRVENNSILTRQDRHYGDWNLN